MEAAESRALLIVSSGTDWYYFREGLNRFYFSSLDEYNYVMDEFFAWSLDRSIKVTQVTLRKLDAHTYSLLLWIKCD